MSWLSEVGHGHFDNPLGWGLEAAGVAAAAVAAPWILPELGAGLGLFGAGEAAAGGAAAGFGGTAGLEALGGAAGAGYGEGGLTALLGGAGGGSADALGAFALDSGFSPFAGVGEALGSGAFDPVGANALTPDGGTIFGAFGEGGAPAAPGASAVSAPAGVSPALGVDPTAAILDPAMVSPFDTAAWPTGPAGAPGGGGVAQITGDVGGIGGAGANPTTVGSATSFGPGSANASPWSIDSLIGSAGKSISSNPLGTALGVGGLGYAISQGQHQPEGTQQMRDIAARLGPAGQQMMQYLQSGTLPPGLAQSVGQANQAARARIISNYGQQGMSTDPSRNSALAQELASVDRATSASIAQIGERLMNQGVQASGLSANIYGQLAAIDQTQTQNVGRAIANMASALSPNRPLVSVQR